MKKQTQIKIDKDFSKAPDPQDIIQAEKIVEMIKKNEKRRKDKMQEILNDILEFNALHWSEIPQNLATLDREQRDRAKSINETWAKKLKCATEKKRGFRSSLDYSREHRSILRENV